MRKILFLLLAISFSSFAQMPWTGSPLVTSVDTSDKVLILKGGFTKKASVGNITRAGGGGSSTIDTTKIYRIEQGRGSTPFLTYFNGTAWARNDTSYVSQTGNTKLTGNLKRIGSSFRVGLRSDYSYIDFGDYNTEITTRGGASTASVQIGSGVSSAVSLIAGTGAINLTVNSGAPSKLTGTYFSGDEVYRDNDSLRYIQLKDAEERFAPIGGSGLTTVYSSNSAIAVDSSITGKRRLTLDNSLTSGYIKIGDGTNQAFPRALSGDVTVSNLGVTKIDTNIWSKKTIDLFIVAGQSNAQGNGSNSASGSPINTANYALQYYNKTLSVCNDPVGNATNASAWPAFAQSYYKLTGKAICVVPSATGATSQTCAADLGAGNWDTCGVLVDSTIARTSRAIVALQAVGWTVNVKGVLWCQGEYDAAGINNSLITQATYIAAFTKMRRRFRNSLGKLPFYIFQTGTRTTQSDAGYESIRQAQINATNIDSLTKVVFYEATSFAKRGLLIDDVHYTGIGYNEMGRVGAENIVGAFKTVQSMGDRKDLFKNSAYLNYSNLGFNTSKVATTLHLNKTITDTVPTSLYSTTSDPFMVSANSYQQMLGYIASSGTTDRFIIKGVSAGGTVMSPSLVGTGRYALTIAGSAYDGTTTLNSGTFNFITEGTPAIGSIPMAFTIETGTSTRTERFRIKSSGEIGIGTSTPLSKLDISGSISVGSTYAGAIAAPTNGAIIEGNVGIGNSSPSYPLTVGTVSSAYNSFIGSSTNAAFSSSTRRFVAIENTATSSTSGGGGFVLLHNDGAAMDAGHRIGNISFSGATNSTTIGQGASIQSFATSTWSTGVSPAYLIFLTAETSTATEKMRITHDGNVGIGATAPNTKLEINGAVSLTPTTSSTISGNYNGFDFGVANTIIRMNVTLTSGLQGIIAKHSGMIYKFVNVGSQSVTFEHEDATATAANRILTSTSADVVVGVNDSITLFYDTTSSRWRQLK